MSMLDKLDVQWLKDLACAVDTRPVRRAVEKLDAPEVMRMLDQLDKPPVVVGVSLGLAALLARRHAESAIAIGLAAPLAVLVGDLFKRTAPEHRPRLFDKHPEQSFPSTHAAGIGALALAVVGNAGAWWALPAALGAKLSVDCARVAKREHWPHDVFWGDLLGIGAAVAAAGVARAYRAWRQAKVARARKAGAVPLAQRRRARARGSVPPPIAQERALQPS
ncbi:MAG: phosphatase PAP2 family protein [Deltaproteobacteria bacterium]|nr:phosphatase PAP2 family protein [Deltaproteobacteria bacterium]